MDTGVCFERERASQGVIVPMFTDDAVGKQFIKRNIPNKDITTGLVSLTTAQIGDIMENGWDIEYMDFPRRFTTHPDYTIDFEILRGQFMIGTKTYRKGG